MTATLDPHADYVRAGRLWHPRRPLTQSIDVIAVIWRDPWHSMAGAIASELVMDRAIAAASSEWTAYAARGICRAAYGEASDFARERAADACLREVGAL